MPVNSALVVIHVILITFTEVIAYSNGDYFFMLMFPLLILGGSLNYIVCNANGGKMPSRLYPGMTREDILRCNGKLLTPRTKHRWLGDIFPLYTPGRVRIFSVGDLFVALAAIMAWVYLTILLFRLNAS